MSEEKSIHTSCRQCIVDGIAEAKAAGRHANMEKFCVPIPPEDGWETTAEWFWGEKVSDGIVALKNIPAYAYGLAIDDKLHIAFRNDCYEFESLHARSGHSTYRVFANTGQEEVLAEVLKELGELGCQYEKASARYAAIDVPSSVDVNVVWDRLSAAEDNGLLSFEEGYCGHVGEEQNPRHSIAKCECDLSG